jgi:hypothetical protein
MKRITLLLIILVAGFALFGFFISPTSNYSIEKYGFFSGLLHGLGSFFSLVLSFFSSKIAVMAKNHTIGYTIGFWIATIFSWSFIITLLRLMFR